MGVKYRFSYKRVKTDYSSFKKKEIMHKIHLEKDQVLLVRLDGKGITKSFKSDGFYTEDLSKIMRYVMNEIQKYGNAIDWAYCVDDEISLLVKRDYLKTKNINDRFEKVLTYLSGYVSSLFTIGSYKETKEMKTTAFDARAIIINKNRIRGYLIARQHFSIQHAIEKAINRFGFVKKGYTIEEIDSLLRTKGEKWSSIPNCSIYGMIGYYNCESQWVVADAMEFDTDVPFVFL